MKISQEALKQFAHQIKEDKEWVKIGMSTCGLAAGAQQIYEYFLEELKKRNLNIKVKKCGCQGNCYAEVLVEVKVDGLPSVTYGKVTKEIAGKIIEKHIVGKMLVNDAIFYSSLE